MSWFFLSLKVGRKQLSFKSLRDWEHEFMCFACDKTCASKSIFVALVLRLLILIFAVVQMFGMSKAVGNGAGTTNSSVPVENVMSRPATTE